MKNNFLYLFCILIKLQSFVAASDLLEEDKENRPPSSRTTKTTDNPKSPSKLLIVTKRSQGNLEQANTVTDIELIKILGEKIAYPTTTKVFDLFDVNANGYKKYKNRLILQQFKAVSNYYPTIDLSTNVDTPFFYSKEYPVYFCVTPSIQELITFSDYLRTITNQVVPYQHQKIVTQFMDGFNQLIETPSTSTASLKDLESYFNPKVFQHASLEALLETYSKNEDLMIEIADQNVKGEADFAEAEEAYYKKYTPAWEMLKEKCIGDEKKLLESKKDEGSSLKAKKIEAKFFKRKSNFERAWREANDRFENREQELVDDPDALKALKLELNQEYEQIWQVFAEKFTCDREIFIEFKKQFIEADAALAEARKAFNIQHFENYARLIYQNVFTNLLVEEFQNDLDANKEVYDLTYNWHHLTESIVTTLGFASTMDEGKAFYESIISPWLKKLFLNSNNYFYDISMFSFDNVGKSHYGTRVHMVKFKADGQVFSMILYGDKPKTITQPARQLAKKDKGCIVS